MNFIKVDAILASALRQRCRKYLRVRACHSMPCLPPHMLRDTGWFVFAKLP